MPEGKMTRMLPVVMDDTDIAGDAKRLAQLLWSIKQAKEELSAIMKDRRAHIADLKAQAGEIENHILTGVREDEVEIREIMAPGRGIVDIIRLDTGEVVTTRAITMAERQSLMPFDGES